MKKSKRFLAILLSAMIAVSAVSAVSSVWRTALLSL